MKADIENQILFHMAPLRATNTVDPLSWSVPDPYGSAPISEITCMVSSGIGEMRLGCRTMTADLRDGN
jgi:hypothetical protein